MGNSQGSASFKAVTNRDAAALAASLKGVNVLQAQSPRPASAGRWGPVCVCVGGRTSEDMMNLLQATVFSGGEPNCLRAILNALNTTEASNETKSRFINARDVLDQNRTPLLQLANFGEEPGVRVLLEYKADATVEDNLGLSALQLAVLKVGGDPKPRLGVVEALLDDSEIEHRDTLGRSALTHAILAHKNRADLIDLLQKGGARLDTQCERGRTVLMQVIKDAEPEVITKLLRDYATSLGMGESRGFRSVADFINHTDATGGSALWEAAQRKSSKVVELLLEYKGDVNVKGPNHWSLLHVAAEADNASLAAIYLQAEPIAELNPRDVNGMTPCHIARFRGSEKVLPLLETCKCNFMIIDERGFSPQALADLPRVTILGAKLTDPVAVEEATLKHRADKKDTWLQDVQNANSVNTGGSAEGSMTDTKDQRHALKQMQGMLATDLRGE